MKNALLFVLGIVVVVLGFLFYKSRGVSYRDYNENKLKTVRCPVRTGQDKKTCIIPISYLTNMVNGWTEDYAIRVHRKDTIKWIGDNGESIEVPEMPAVNCSDHSPGVHTGGDPSLISQISPPGNIVTAQVTENPKNDHYCYKNTITVTQNGKTTKIDPHYFADGQVSAAND